MKVILFIVLICLVSCSYTDYQKFHSEQRRHAEKRDDYIEWSKVKTVVNSKCTEIKNIYQGHDRVVFVSFKDGTSFSTISPKIDQILDVVYECNGSYNNVNIIME